MRFPLWLLSGVLLVGICACSGSSGGDKDAAADAQPDQATDVADAAGDTTDAALPDPGNDKVEDLAPVDEKDPAEGLPGLPPDKQFGTRYAAGTASVEINPVKPAYMGGYGFCAGKPENCRKSEGIHDPLKAQAVALADTEAGTVVVFVGVDSIGIIGFDVRIIQKTAHKRFAEELKVNVPGPQVVVGASHSHGAPDMSGLFGPMELEVRDEEEYIKFVREQVAAVAVEACKNLADVTLDWGQGTLPNHEKDDETDDEDLFVLRGKGQDGATVFTLMRWPSHPTGYGNENHGISADWVGVYRKTMEEELGGTAVFFNGPIGSLYPDTPQPCNDTDAFPEGWQDPEVGPEEHAQVACIGHGAAQVAMDALEESMPVAETGIEFLDTPFEFHPTNFIFMELIKLSPIPIPELDADDPTAMLTSELSVIRVGDLTYVTTPGESFPTFAKHAKEAVTAAGFANPIVFGLAQDWMGYLLAADQWDDPDLGYNRSLSPGELVEPAYLDALKNLVK